MKSISLSKFVLLLGIILVCSYQSVAQSTRGQNLRSGSIPNTPVGRQFAAWVAAFNTGKRETMRRVINEHFEKLPSGPLPLDQMAEHDVATFRESGGFLVRKIVSSSSTTITALVESRLTGYWMQLQFYIQADPPAYEAVPPYNVVGVGFSQTQSPTELLPKRTMPDREIYAKTDDLITKLIRVDRFSGAILVARNGKILYERVSGFADRVCRVPNRLDTKFNLASMTKMFTALAVAQLVEKGRFSLDDTVGKILPDYPNKEIANRVTINQLLTHTSGLASADRTADRLLATLRQGARTVDEHVVAFVNDPLTFEPGSRFDYSNYGYMLLGAIIENASGQNYYNYVRENVFRPAGMTNSDFYELDSDPPNLAVGLMDAPTGPRRSNALFIGVKGTPAGGAYSTIGNLLKFDRALRNQKLLSAKMTDYLWTGSPRNARYGGGFEIKTYNKTRIIGHGGGWFGITNQMEIYPELGWTVVILSNYDSNPTAIANKLREWMTQSPSNEIPTAPAFTLVVTISPQTVAPGEPAKITVTVKNSGGKAEEKIIDMEARDASDGKVEQQFTGGQSFNAGELKTYTYIWMPTKAGSYTIDVGIFGDNWATKHTVAKGVATITVK
jgi:CubicO group peptidase (beta-lactamase class C family)